MRFIKGYNVTSDNEDAPNAMLRRFIRDGLRGRSILRTYTSSTATGRKAQQ